VALKVDVTERHDLVRKCEVSSPPTILILDSKGREFYRSLGFLPPDRFICQEELADAIARKQD
jgi:thioredoxin-related protein